MENKELTLEVEQSETYRTFEGIAPYLGSILRADYVIGFNTVYECVKLYSSFTKKYDYNIGPVTEETVAYRCIKAGEMILDEMSIGRTGVPYRSTGIPIKNKNNKTIGCIVVSTFLDKQKKVADMSEELSKSANELLSYITKVSLGIEEIVGKNRNTREMLDETVKHTEQTDNVIGFIKDVSKKSNLLGLNASIESARAGEAGKGFGVVATEIRKLADSSNQSIKAIEATLSSIKNNAKTIFENIEKDIVMHEQYSDDLKEIKNLIFDLEKLSNELEDISKKY